MLFGMAAAPGQAIDHGGMLLCFVGGKEIWAAIAFEDSGDTPAQSEGVFDSSIHAIAAMGWVAVG